MASVSEILSQRKPLEQQCRLLLDGQLRSDIDQLRRQVRQAKQREMLEGSDLASPLAQLQRDLAELEARADAEAVVFTFRAIGRAELAALQERHPPTAAQLERYRQKAKVNPLARPPEFDPDGLAPDLIAASCADPRMTVDEAKRLWDELSDGEAAELWAAAWQVNQETASRPTSGPGTEPTPTSGPGSDTPANGASPSPSTPGGS